MSRDARREVERRLRGLARRGGGEPPAGLLDRLKADVPDEPPAPALDELPAAPVWHPHRWRIAAALVMVIGAGGLAWMLRGAIGERGGAEPARAALEAEAPAAGTAPAGERAAAAAAGETATDALADRETSVGREALKRRQQVAPAPPPPSAPALQEPSAPAPPPPSGLAPRRSPVPPQAEASSSGAGDAPEALAEREREERAREGTEPRPEAVAPPLPPAQENAARQAGAKRTAGRPEDGEPRAGSRRDRQQGELREELERRQRDEADVVLRLEDEARPSAGAAAGGTLEPGTAAAAPEEKREPAEPAGPAEPEPPILDPSASTTAEFEAGNSEQPVNRTFQGLALAAPGVGQVSPAVLGQLLGAGRLPEPGRVAVGPLVAHFAGGSPGLAPAAGDGPAVGAAAVPSPLPGRAGAWLVVFEVAPPRALAGFTGARVDVGVTGAVATRRILSGSLGAAAAPGGGPAGGSPMLVIYEVEPAAGEAGPAAELTLSYRAAGGEEVEVTRPLGPADTAASWEAAPPRLRLALLAAELGAALQRTDRTGIEPDLAAIATAAAALTDDLPAAAELARLAARAAELTADR